MKVRLLKAQTTNESLLKKDEKILKLTFDSENNEKSDIKEVVTFDKKKNYKLVRVLENALLTSSLSEVDVKIAFHVQLLIRMNDQHQADKRDSEKVFLAILQKDFLEILLDQNDEQTSCEICSQKAEDQDERLEDFDTKKITSTFHETLAAEQQFKVHKQNLS